VFAQATNARYATVRLLRPPPLETDLEPRLADEGVRIFDGSDDVALVTEVRADLASVRLPWLSDREVLAAERHWIEHVEPEHIFPTCFGCGGARPESDGLELFAGEVPDSDLCAAFWTPDASLTDAEGAVEEWAVWAAMDCPSGAAAVRGAWEESAAVLGEMAVRVDATPAVGERHQVVARHVAVEGRRLLSEVAVVASDGTNLAVGTATWIRIPRPGGTEH
jgi:hypothetical protein